MRTKERRTAVPQGLSALKLLTFICLCWVVPFTQAATPQSTVTAPSESFVGEAFCLDASLSNSGSPGYSPYYQIVTKPGYTLSSASFIANTLPITNVGTFPNSAPLELTDPLIDLSVTGPAGGNLYTVEFPIGSLVSGQPALTATFCLDVANTEVVNVLQPDAFELIPVYRFGDTATGNNGPEVGTRDSFDFTPREIIYSISDSTAEMERPPGPAWAWDIEIVADIASNRTINGVDFTPIEPILLPPNVQFLGPVTFSGSGVTCTANTPTPPPTGSPGGQVTLNCVQGTGTIGEDEDIVVTFPVYITDTLDSNSCDDGSAINTAKHLTIQKSATESGIPGSTINYSIRFDVSEFVDGVTSLSVVDVLPDGMTYIDAPMLSYSGNTTTLPHVVANNTPGAGETRVTYDVTAVTGNLPAAGTGLITYSATVDQTYDAAPLAGQPLRARDTLVNSVVGTYDIQNGQNSCTDNSSATVTVDNVTISKTLVSPASGQVQAGDPVTWRLRLDIPSGDVQGIRFTDFFPLPVVDVSTIDDTVGIGSNSDINFGPNHNATNNGAPIDATAITLSTAANSLEILWEDVVSASPQTIEVDVSAIISDEPFADGLILSNVVQGKTDNSGVDNINGIQISQITLQQPELSINKSVSGSTNGYEAGDNVVFDLNITNNGSAPAFDVIVTDTPDPELTGCTVTNTSGASGGTPNNMFGAGYQIPTFTGATNNALDPGDSVTFEITCAIALTASNQDQLENTANVIWATQPNATPFPPQEDSATATTAQAQVFKEIVTTSETITDDTTADTNGDRRPVVAGEIIRYRAWAYIPQGTLSSVAIRDVLPPGLEYVAGQTFIGLVSDTLGNLTASSLVCASGSPNFVGDNNTDLSSLNLTCPIEPSSGGTGSGNDPYFTLGTVTNTEDDNNNELVVIEFNAAVLDNPTGTSLANRMRLNTANGNPQSGAVYAEQQVPALTVLKTVTPTSADGDDRVEYIITVRHNEPTSDITAYDISLTDIVPNGLTYDSVTGIPAPNNPPNPGTELCVAPNFNADDSNPAATPGLVITFDQLAVGDACEFHFFADTDSGIAPGQTITNTANIAYDSLPGTGTATNPTGSLPGTQGSYTGSADADLAIEAVELIKSIISTSIPETSDTSADTNADPRQLVLGETLRYRLLMRLPEGDADDFVVTDNLPTGLQYVVGTARLALVYDFGGGTVTSSPGITCASGSLDQAGNETTIGNITPNCALEPSGGPFGNGTDLVWDLGDLTNNNMDANQEFVVFEFDAQALDTAANRSGAVFANDYSLSLDGGASTTTSNTAVAEAEAPEFGLAKRVLTGPTNNGDGTYTLTYRFAVENGGSLPVTNVQVTDNLATTFSGATYTVDALSSSTLSVAFPGFDGNGTQNMLSGSDTISASTTHNIDLTLTVTPGANLGTFNNTASVTAQLPGGANLSDTSHNGTTPDGNSDGDPTNDSAVTPVTLGETPLVGISKVVNAGPTNNGDGTFTLTYRLFLENFGDVSLSNVQVVDDLASTFNLASGYVVDSTSAVGVTVNPAYTGIAPNTNLLLGTDSLAISSTATIDLSVTVTPGANLGPYNNNASVNGTSPAGATATDDSQAGNDPDSNGNDDPTDDTGPTPVSFVEGVSIGLAKTISAAPVYNGDGTFTLTYQMRVENTGDTLLNSVQVIEVLSTTFANATAFTVDAVTSPSLSINPTFSGIAPNDALLDASDSLPVSAFGTIDLVVTVTPGATLSYNNSAVANAVSPSNDPVTDTSDDGLVVDENGNGDPTDDNDPTNVTFPEQAIIGLAKAASSPSTPNYDGTFTSTITLLVANMGNVPLTNIVVVDNIASEIAPASVTQISNLNVVGALSALNSSFDGIAVTDITDGTESLAAGEQATITFDLTFNPNDNPGPFNNQATVSAESPSNPNPGTPDVTDLSTDGSNPDTNGNVDPTDDDTPTPIVYVAGSSCTLQMPAEIVPGQAFSIGVEDNDSFYDSAAIDTLQVVVRNTLSGEVETVTLTESGVATGAFSGSLTVNYNVTAGANDDGILFAQHADTITSTHTDVFSATGGTADCTASGELLGLATLEGTAWLDNDTDDNFDPGEAPLDGWVIEVYRDGVQVGTVPVNPDGSYSVPNLIPGTGYEVNLVHPTSNATFGQIEDITLPPQTTVLDQNMPIDPSGVFYDSVTREPIEGVTATMINENGTPLPAACLLSGQQNQVSGDDGFYRFDLVLGADPACPSGGTYTIVVAEPVEYNPGFSALLPPLAGPLDPTGLGSPARIGDDSTAPTLNNSTNYYVNFTLANGDPDVVWNHIPLDPFGVGGFSVRMTKDVDRPTTTVGGLVSYTITLENLSTVAIPGISVEDRIPAGFTFVPESATLDGVQGTVAATGARPIIFAGITLNSGQRRVLRYLLRAGAGVVRGEYVNTATPYVGPAQIGNTDTATVMVVADPDFEETTIIGKVWNDRDEDGWQDSAIATQLKLEVDFARNNKNPEQTGNSMVALGDEIPRDSGLQLALGVKINSLAGRYGAGDFSGSNQVTITSYYKQPVKVSEIRLRTKEGTRIFAKADETRHKHVGAVKRGRSSQDIDLTYHQERTDRGYALIITLTNRGMDEPGLPGVRLATVEGLLIETDAFGRYHVAGVDAGFVERGRNFIVKVDPATLPKQTTFVTENPRVKRLSQGLMNQFDFGVHLPESEPPQQRVRVKVAEMFFAPGSAQVLPEYKDQLRELVRSLARGSAITLEMHSYLRADLPSGAAQNLAKARAQALQREIRLMRGEKSAIDIELDLSTNKRASRERIPTKPLKTMGGQQ